MIANLGMLIFYLPGIVGPLASAGPMLERFLSLGALVGIYLGYRLIHELAHYLAYRWYGIPATQLHLCLFPGRVSVRGVRLPARPMIRVALASLWAMLSLTIVGIGCIIGFFGTNRLELLLVGLALLPSPLSSLGDVHWAKEVRRHPHATFADEGGALRVHIEHSA